MTIRLAENRFGQNNIQSCAYPTEPRGAHDQIWKRALFSRVYTWRLQLDWFNPVVYKRKLRNETSADVGNQKPIRCSNGTRFGNPNIPRYKRFEMTGNHRGRVYGRYKRASLNMPDGQSASGISQAEKI
jgi:hypothetical protein